MEIPWGWELFFKDTLSYDNRLAIAGLALSSPIERDYEHTRELPYTLGFENRVIMSMTRLYPEI